MHRTLSRHFWVAALLVSACKRDGGLLVDVIDVAAGADCAAGGVRIDSGVDVDRSGTLDPGEVTSSDVVCDAPPVATRATEVPSGDPNCPYGGTRVDAGLDDGLPSGVPGDGVLQDAEVDSSSYVCEPEPQFVPQPVDPPAGAPAGVFAIDLAGGTGTNATGGAGGSISVTMDAGTVGGGIRVFPTDPGPVPFSYPADIDFDLGPEPVEITADTTIPLNPSVSSLADGTPYMDTVHTGLLIRRAAAPGGFAFATGLDVAAGVTLTLPGNTPGPNASLTFGNDVHIAGTLTTVRVSGAPASLILACGNFVGEPTGRVDLSGADGSGTLGAAGGVFTINAIESGLASDFGSVFNAAAVDISGGDNMIGGPAGQVDWNANFRIWNAGDIDAHGGNGSGGTGGIGGYDVGMEASGGIYNEGDVDVPGGDGTTASAYGGEFSLYSLFGPIVQLGDVEASGGDVTACVTTCTGAYGGNLRIEGGGGPYIVGGDLTSLGGDAPKLGTTTGTTTGGTGGYLIVTNDGTGPGWNASYTVLGDIVVAGNVQMSGGSGATGGGGGQILVAGDWSFVPDDQQVLLLGYTEADLSGGDGATSGGHGGHVVLGTTRAVVDVGGGFGAGGAIANHVGFDLSGGDGPVGGGTGGSFNATTDGHYGQFFPSEVVVNRGAIDASGGDGGFAGGSGSIILFGSAGVENSASLAAGGGSGNAAPMGLEPSRISLLAEEGPAVSSGSLSAAGGSTTNGAGEPGGLVEVIGKGVTVSGSVDAGGGSGSTTGGGGGTLFVLSLGTPSSITGTVGVLGGTGTTAGAHGQVLVDGENVTQDFVP